MSTALILFSCLCAHLAAAGYACHIIKMNGCLSNAEKYRSRQTSKN